MSAVTPDLLRDAEQAWNRLSINERNEWALHLDPRRAFMAEYINTRLFAPAPSTEENAAPFREVWCGWCACDVPLRSDGTYMAHRGLESPLCPGSQTAPRASGGGGS